MNTGASNAPFIIDHSDWTSVGSTGKKKETSWSVRPKTFKILSKEEIEKEVVATKITNIATAFSSFLKIPSAGYRTKSGSMPTNSSALLWVRSAIANSATNELDARYSLAANATSGFHSIERSYGLSVRCISINDPIPPSD